MRIYIAGQMSGLPNFNADAFNKAAKLLRDQGHEVINPPELDHDDGFDVIGKDGKIDPVLRRQFLGRDFKLISGCDGLYMLKGWEKSSGASLERLFALDTDMKVMYEE